MRENKRERILPITLMFILMVMLCMSGTAEASSSKVVKSVTLKIGKKKVTNQTCYLVEGKTATLKVSVTPSKAKKSVSYKSSNQKIATVSKKGKIKAKKTGTAKITVTVKGKNGKKKTSYVKIKVTKTHKHTWKKITQRKYVVDERAWDEGVYKRKEVCYGNKLLNETCDYTADTEEDITNHAAEKHHSYGVGTVKVGTIHHDEIGQYETVVIDRKCKVCGVFESQL